MVYKDKHVPTNYADDQNVMAIFFLNKKFHPIHFYHLELQLRTQKNCTKTRYYFLASVGETGLFLWFHETSEVIVSFFVLPCSKGHSGWSLLIYYSNDLSIGMLYISTYVHSAELFDLNCTKTEQGKGGEKLCWLYKPKTNKTIDVSFVQDLTLILSTGWQKYSSYFLSCSNSEKINQSSLSR